MRIAVAASVLLAFVALPALAMEPTMPGNSGQPTGLGRSRNPQNDQPQNDQSRDKKSPPQQGQQSGDQEKKKKEDKDDR